MGNTETGGDEERTLEEHCGSKNDIDFENKKQAKLLYKTPLDSPTKDYETKPGWENS